MQQALLVGIVNSHRLDIAMSSLGSYRLSRKSIERIFVKTKSTGTPVDLELILQQVLY